MRDLFRAESSVRCELGATGEVVFAGDQPGPVRHRTPEELGLARTVPADPPRRTLPWIRMDEPVSVPRRRYEQRSDGKAKRALRSKEGIEKLSAGKAAESEVSVVKGMTEEVKRLRDLVLAEPMEMPVADVCAKHGATKEQVYQWRFAQRKKTGVAADRSAAQRARTPKPKPSNICPVEIDPHRDGSAAALLDTLERMDAQSDPMAARRANLVTIELSEDEVVRAAQNLGAERFRQFLIAGFRAALLG